MIETGFSDIVQELKRFNYDVKETNPEENVSGMAGFRAVRNGVTVTYDGGLYINNEPVQTPWGIFELSLQEHVHWFLEHFHALVKDSHDAGVRHHLANRPEDRMDNFDGNS